MAEIDTTSKETTVKKANTIPEFVEVTSHPDSDKWEYEEKLKKYFLSGKISDQNPRMNWKSLPIAAYIDETGDDWGYPIVLKHKTGDIVPLTEYIGSLSNEKLREEDAKTIRSELPKISRNIHEVVIKTENISNNLKLTKEVVEILFGFREGLIEPEYWVDLCKIVEKELVTDKIAIIGFSELTPFLLFKHQLNLCHSCHLDFLVEINKRIAGLNDILVLHGGASSSSEGQFGFASDLVSFNEIDKIAPLKASSKLPESRLKRVQKCYKILVDAQNSYRDYSTIIFSNKELSDSYQLSKICGEGVLKLVKDKVCKEAKSFYQEEIEKFALVVAAIKVADLELTQQYVEDLHDAYFENYDVNYLGDEDLQFMRTIVVIDYSKELMRDASDFLGLVSGGALIHIIGVTRLEELNKMIRKEKGYLELASLAFSRRKAFVYQGGVDNPAGLYNAFNIGLDEPYPVLWNILVGKPGASSLEDDFFKAKIARESRLFPEILYNVDVGDAFGSHFDLSENTQTKAVMPLFNQQVKSSGNIQEIECSLTMADFLSLNEENHSNLEIIPPWYQSDDLVPLESYLNAGFHAMDQKIPFIWGIDTDDKMYKIAIPISWVIFCRKRLDYWRFLQELGGVNNPLVETAVMREKAIWSEEKTNEINELESSLQNDFEQARSADLEKAVKRMLYRLINGDVDLNTLSIDSGAIEAEPAVSAVVEKSEPKVEEKQIEPEPDPTKSISPEAWVESDECTSCNDCIDAVPGVFKYNDDKQAMVHNPAGASYAKIVSAAEKCPAGCIHPGLPHDKNETNLEKLIKRAEKFN